MVDINGQYDPNAQADTGFDLIPAGTKVIAVIEQSEQRAISQHNDYGDKITFTWKIQGENYNGRLIWQDVNMMGRNMNNNDKVVSIAMSQFAAIREACGKAHVQDTDELHHIPCEITIGVDKSSNPQYPDRNTVKSVKPANAASASANNGGVNAAAGAAQQSASNEQKTPWPKTA